MIEAPPRGPERPGPADGQSHGTRAELRKAAVWLGMAAVIVLAVFAAKAILLILAGFVFATMADGGVRLLGRVLPIGRGWRLLIVLVGVFGFLAYVLYYAGSVIVAQAALLPGILETQLARLENWAASVGFQADIQNLQGFASQAMSGVGQVTSAVTGVFGALGSLALVVVLGIFLAAEPRLYERGMAWMIPMQDRAWFYGTLGKMSFALRRLLAGRMLGMVIEGIGTWLLLWVYGVPMAALLGLLTGLLAFLPNIGAIVSGGLMIMVGFSGGWEMGLYTVFVYVFVQTVDGNIIVPMVAKRTVDLAPALVLAAQLVMGTLFGILGLALADPMVAMIKIALERHTARKHGVAGSEAVVGPPPRATTG